MSVVERALPESLRSALIAPCGMNCGLCIAHRRTRKRCDGCNGDDATKPNHCVVCYIKTCEQTAGRTGAMCSDCASFPCARVRQLDRRYRAKYGMSMIENLQRIGDVGIDEFVASEMLRWACPECGSLLCVHRPECLNCGHVWNPPTSG